MTEMTPHELPGNIFMQPWWLDIVAPNQWEDIRIEKGGEIYARWPVVKRKEKGFTFVQMPVLTQKLGPWIKQTSPKIETVHSTERSMLEKLIEKLPHFDKLTYNLSEDIVNYLPFIWNGFTQHSLTTFRFEYPFDTDKTWKRLKSSVRRDIRRAEEELEVSKNIKAGELYDMVVKTFDRQGLKPSYSKEVITELVKQASARERASIFGAKDSEGKLHAAQLFIHDDDATYYLAGGFEPDSDVPGAVSLVLWNGIKEANNRENAFDFEGSSIKSIERYFSSFGAKQVYFHNIQAVSKRFAPFYYGKKLLKRIKE
ncbi:GNAT family N-acetyltransferase [Gracilimonas sp.]|uniref:GNAT family N-acetyltransferase n=1 Tax=Gracilimonas sp. TaxID=1974203 RepID=UPI003D11BF25